MSHMSDRSWRYSGRMSHGTHTWVSHVNESYQWAMSMSHINDSCHTWVSAFGDVQVEWVLSHTHERVTSHIWASPATCVNELFTPTWVRLHTQNEAFVRMTESCHTWVSTLGDIQANKSCHTHMDESRLTYEWVLSNMWMSRFILAFFM